MAPLSPLTKLCCKCFVQVATAPNVPRQPRGSPTKPEQSDLNDTISGLEATSRKVDAERRIDADPSHRLGDPTSAQKVTHTHSPRT